ncbi:MAG TPA: NAD(P)/FAD-dependent oxidoreductase [Candidatus Paceibacterota bacterium]|nr:NAD(P)/FAD-dependent oxidoreductase [Candidatus Paceibacterota bacterium]
MSSIPKTRIVILGAGFGGMYAARSLFSKFKGCDDVEIIVVNRRNYFLFTPLLHEVATGNISPENIIEPIRALLGPNGDLYCGSVESVSLKDRKVFTDQGEISYDYLVLALGSETNFFNIPGATEHCHELKTLEDALKIKNQIIESLEKALRIADKAERQKLLSFVVIGGGPTGVELAGELADFLWGTFRRYYPAWLIDEISISLVHRDAELLPQFAPAIRGRALKTLLAKKIEVLLSQEVVSISADQVELASGKKITSGMSIWTAGVRPPRIVFDRELETARDGRLVVDEYLRLKGEENVFVIGDLACSLDWRTHKPLPALAQVALRQGRFVADAVYRNLIHRPLLPFRYRHGGSLVSVGEWRAAGQFGPLHIWGRTAWWFWRAAYWFKLLSVSKRLQVGLDWFIDLFLPRDVSDYYEGSGKK